MNSVIIQPAVTLRQPAPVRIPLPVDGANQGDTLVLVDVASGDRVPAQRDGEKAVIAVVGGLPGERRFRVETAAAGSGGVTISRRGPHQIEIRVGDQLLTEYNDDPANARPFFYPVI